MLIVPLLVFARRLCVKRAVVRPNGELSCGGQTQCYFFCWSVCIRRAEPLGRPGFICSREASQWWKSYRVGASVLWSAWPHTRPKWESNSVFLLYEYLLRALHVLPFIQIVSLGEMSNNRSLECTVNVRPPYRIASENPSCFICCCIHIHFF